MEFELLRFGENNNSVNGVLLRDNCVYAYTLQLGGNEAPTGRHKVVIDRTIQTTNRHHEKSAHLDTQYYSRIGQKKRMKHGCLLVKTGGLKRVLICAASHPEDAGDDIAVGNKAVQNQTKPGALSGSLEAYQRLYLDVLDATQKGKDVYLTIKDY